MFGWFARFICRLKPLAGFDIAVGIREPNGSRTPVEADAIQKLIALGASVYELDVASVRAIARDGSSALDTSMPYDFVVVGQFIATSRTEELGNPDIPFGSYDAAVTAHTLDFRVFMGRRVVTAGTPRWITSTPVDMENDGTRLRNLDLASRKLSTVVERAVRAQVRLLLKAA